MLVSITVYHQRVTCFIIFLFHSHASSTSHIAVDLWKVCLVIHLYIYLTSTRYLLLHYFSLISHFSLSRCHTIDLWKELLSYSFLSVSTRLLWHTFWHSLFLDHRDELPSLCAEFSRSGLAGHSGLSLQVFFKATEIRSQVLFHVQDTDTSYHHHLDPYTGLRSSPQPAWVFTTRCTLECLLTRAYLSFLPLGTTRQITMETEDNLQAWERHSGTIQLAFLPFFPPSFLLFLLLYPW